MTLNIFWQTLLFFIVAYMFGSVLGSQVVGKFLSINVKEHGSKNPGATNMLRVKGKKAAFVTLLIDFTKPIAAFGVLVLMSAYIPDGRIEMGLLGVIVGHCFPWTSGFKGGKGVATTFGLLFVLNWIIALSVLTCWLILFKVTKISSLSSLVSFWVVGSLIWIPVFWQNPGLTVLYDGFYHANNFPYIPLAMMFINLFVTIRHKSNICNLINGKETQSEITEDGLDAGELEKVSESHENNKIIESIKKDK